MALKLDQLELQSSKTISLHKVNSPQNGPRFTNSMRTLKIPLPTKKGLEFVLWTDILYIKSDGNYTRLFLASGKEIFVSMMLSCFERVMPLEWFIRIHHQYIINVQHLVRYEKGDGGMAWLINDVALPVSREKKKSFLTKVIGDPL